MQRLLRWARIDAGEAVPHEVNLMGKAVMAIMPWAAYGRMTDDDVRAIYRYLRTLEPVARDTGPLATRSAG